jgi:ParB family chromosome partitioning protein
MPFPRKLKLCVNGSGHSETSLAFLVSSRTKRHALPIPRESLYDIHGDRHDAFMQFPWQKSRDGQLDLLDEASVPNSLSHLASPHPLASELAPTPTVSPRSTSTASAANGRPLQVAIFLLYLDPDNPRTEFAEENINDLAQDIRERGILQPIVVHPADAAGRYRIHFGALRLRAARKAGLQDVPIVVRDVAADPYAQLAENLKRHALSPIEIARFIKGRVDAGESNAAIAKRIGMNLTSVAHHLTLLDLPPELDQAMQSGRCTSPRTLHELNRLHAETPEAVKAFVAGGAEITRTSVAALRDVAGSTQVAATALRPSASLLTQATTACTRLERIVDRVQHAGLSDTDREALRSRVVNLATRLA